MASWLCVSDGNLFLLLYGTYCGYVVEPSSPARTCGKDRAKTTPPPPKELDDGVGGQYSKRPWRGGAVNPTQNHKNHAPSKMVEVWAVIHHLRNDEVYHPFFVAKGSCLVEGFHSSKLRVWLQFYI